MPLAPDDRLGAYKILSLLGEGAMGEVYRVRDITLGREFALRILPADFVSDPKRVARFRDAVQALTTLHHPRIMGYYAFTQDERTHFMVVEFVPGGTLAARLQAGPLAVADTLAIARQIGEGLKVGHDKGITHGDLKPSHVGFTANDRVKLLDFGLARAMEAATAQAEAPKADKRTDVQAFGRVLYEMLAGNPDVGRTLSGPPSGPDLSELPADTPASIRTVIKGCLEQDGEQQIADIPTALSLMDAPAPAPVPAAPPSQSSPRADTIGPKPPRTQAPTRLRTEAPTHLRTEAPKNPNPPAARPVVPKAAASVASIPAPSRNWRLVAMVAVPVVLVLGVGAYLLVGRTRVQPDTAPVPQAEAPPAPEPAAPEPAAPSSEVVLTNRTLSARPPRLTAGALEQANGLFRPGSIAEGIQELDRLAELSRAERRSGVLTDEGRGLHRQLFLDRADRNARTDPAKTDDSLRELIRLDPMYSPPFSAELQKRLEAVRSRDTGTLQISSPVAGSTIRVNGAIVGVTGSKPLSVRVMPGEVEIRAHKDDFPRDGTTRTSVTVGATVVVSSIAPRRVVQPIVLLVDRLDANVYVRKASVERTVYSLDPRQNFPTDVVLNNGVAQKPMLLSAWKAQAPLLAAVELDRRLAGTGLDPNGVGVFVVPQEALEYNRAIHVLFLRECYKSAGKRIVLTEAFLKANETAPLLWLDDNSVVRLALDPGVSYLQQCRALKP